MIEKLVFVRLSLDPEGRKTLTLDATQDLGFWVAFTAQGLHDGIFARASFVPGTFSLDVFLSDGELLFTPETLELMESKPHVNFRERDVLDLMRGPFDLQDHTEAERAFYRDAFEVVVKSSPTVARYDSRLLGLDFL